VDEPEATAELVVDIVAWRVPRRFGINPRDIQVLTPMHRGPAGAGNLNSVLQQALARGRAHPSGGTAPGSSGPATR
jgi:exodeoxyribonuclease V alpha subunit